MQYSLTSQTQAVFIQRRHDLAKKLNGYTAVIPAGCTQVRNFKANIYTPVRASSHFLYFIGLNLLESVLVIDENESALYMSPSTVSDALWHGAVPNFEEIGKILQCAVYDITTLAQRLKQMNHLCVLPQAQRNTAEQQKHWIGRDFNADQDAPLIDAIINARLIHDDLAINEMKNAMKLTQQAHHIGMQNTKVNQTAHHVKAHMDFVVQQAGLTTAYTPIITPQGQVLHNHHYHDLLNDHDLLLVDFGVESALGWATDVTRTWPVNGRWSHTQLEIYQLVWDSLEKCIEKVHVGIEYREIHATALSVLTQGLLDIGILKGNLSDVLAANSTALFFPHGIGHLLGLDVHDMEDLGDWAGYTKGRERDTRFSWKYLRLDRPLQENMAITIEPGFYQVEALLKNPHLVSESAANYVDWNKLEYFSDVKGIRIEDDIVVTSMGAHVLSGDILKDPYKIADQSIYSGSA